MKPLEQLLAQIARQHLDVETLESRRSDRLDFHDLAVWSIKAALEAAYQAGVEQGRRQAAKSDQAKH
jgi:hypothetical protein